MKAMTGREKQKIVSILEIVNNAMKCHQDKTAEDDRRMSYFVGLGTDYGPENRRGPWRGWPNTRHASPDDIQHSRLFDL